MTAVMSTSLKVVSIAAVLCASTSRLAIVARRFDMRTRSSVRSPSGRRRSSPTGGTGLRLGGWRGRRGAGAAGAGARGGLSTSRFITRPASPLPRTLREIDVVLLPPPSAPSASRAAFARRRLRRLGRAPAPPASAGAPSALACAARRRLVDDPEHFADLHVLAVLAVDAAQHAGLRRADLEVDLVGLELDERIAGGDGVAFLPQPLGDARVDDGLTDFGHDDV